MRPKALRPGCSEFRRHVVEAPRYENSRLHKIHEAELRAANTRGVFEHALEHRLQIAGRPADDAQHLRRRGLLLQGFRSSRVLACTSSNSRTLPIAITAWSAKVCSSAICLSLNGRDFGAREARSRRCSRLRAAAARLRTVRTLPIACDNSRRSREIVAFGRENRAHAPATRSMTARPAVQSRLIGYESPDDRNRARDAR